MDTLTQIVLGATVGHVVAGRKLGAKAALYGAIGGLLPDLDVMLSSSEPLGEWKYHRGATHSIWFGPVVGTALGWIGWKLARWRRPDTPGAGDDALKYWIGMWVLAIFTHPLLDTFTVYGTQLLAPFTRERFALSGVPIIDPVYTIILLIGLIVVSRVGSRTRKAMMASAVALALSTSYLFVGLAQNGRAEKLAIASLASQGMKPEKLRVYTTMFTIWQRRLVATFDDKYLVGFVSTFNPQAIHWHAIKRNANATTLAEAALSTPDGEAYRKFAAGPIYASVEEKEGAPLLRIYDMRYGFPGPSITGIWGAQWKVKQGKTVDPVSAFRSRPKVSWNDVVQLLRASFGLSNTLF
ncbi:MAG: metal-dependent hydrolase [Hyphomicrobiales bacterium]